jgi:hypothetical protein
VCGSALQDPRQHRHRAQDPALGSIFISWLRSSTSAPEILKSAAHAQKHSEARKASEDYDQEADDRLVKAAYEFNIQFASTFTAESVVSTGGEGSSSFDNVPAAAAPLPEAAAPLAAAPPAPPSNDSWMLPPIPQADVNAQLAEVCFTKSKAKGNGDCFPLSAMAGFEITATAARQPRAGTTVSVREVRQGGVGVLAGDAAVGGIDAAVFRDGEGLPKDAAAAREAMAPWFESFFWNTANGIKFDSFMLGVGLHLKRPVAVIDRKSKTFLNALKVYGARTPMARYSTPSPSPTRRRRPPPSSSCPSPTWSRRCAPIPSHARSSSSTGRITSILGFSSRRFVLRLRLQQQLYPRRRWRRWQRWRRRRWRRRWRRR